MSIPTTKSFTINELICPTTKKPFGDKYAGTFSIRRPSLLDKKNIAVRDAASLSFAGDIAAGTISDNITMINYIYCYVNTVNTEDLPKWFDMATMFEPEDEDAIMAVWGEVVKFLATFRPKTVGIDGGAGSDQPSLLVPSEI